MNNNNDSQSPSSDTEFASATTTQHDGGGSRQSEEDDSSQTPTILGIGVITEASRDWRDVFWLGIFTIHLIGLGFLLSVLGLNRFQKPDRLKIDKYTSRFIENQVHLSHLTETYWPFYVVAGAVGTTLGWIWLLLLGSRANQMMRISVHILTIYLAVIRESTSVTPST